VIGLVDDMGYTLWTMGDFAIFTYKKFEGKRTPEKIALKAPFCDFFVFVCNSSRKCKKFKFGAFLGDLEGICALLRYLTLHTECP